MKKEFFTGLTAMVLSIGFVLTVLVACDSPTNGTNGTNGDTYIGSVVLVGPEVAAADLAAAFAESGARAVYEGNVVLASSVTSVYGEVPAGRKLIALRGGANSTKVTNNETLDVKGTLEVAASASLDVSLSSTGTIKLAGGVVDVQGSIKLNASNPANSFTGDTPAFGTNVKFGPTANADIGAGTAAQVNGLFAAGIARVASSADLIKATSSLDALSGWTAGKTLVLTGTNTVTGAVSLVGVAGHLVVGSGGTIAATADNLLAGTAAAGGDITVLTGGTISITTDTLGGGIVFDGGTLSLSDTSGEIATTVDLSAGTVAAASGTPTLALAAGYTGKIGTISAADQIPLIVTGPTAISIGTLTAITSSGGVALTIPAAATATIDTVDISAGSNAITLTGQTAGSTFIVSEVAGGAVEAAATYTVLRLPAGGLTVGDSAELSHAGTPATTFAPGIYTPTGTVEVSAAGLLSIGTGLALTGDDAKISSTIAGYGGVTAGAVTLLDKVTGGTMEVTDAVDLTSISAEVTFNNATTLEFGNTLATKGTFNVTFNGPVVFNDNVTVTSTETLTLLGNSKLLGSGTALAAATGTVVVGGTVGEATNKVTLTKATLTNASEDDGEIDLNGATGVVTVRWDTAGSKIALADTGTIVTAGTGNVLVGPGLKIGGAVTTITVTDSNDKLGIFTATADGATLVINTGGSGAIGNGISIGGELELLTLADTVATYTFTASSENELPVVISGTGITAPADGGTGGELGAIITLVANSKVVLGDGSITLGGIASTDTTGGGKLVAVANGTLGVFTNTTSENFKISAGQALVGGAEGTAAEITVGSANSAGTVTLATIDVYGAKSGTSDAVNGVISKATLLNS